MTTQINQSHILIVDDEPLSLEIIGCYLELGHYKVSTALNGAIAWEILEKSPNNFDIILLDRMMPIMNGLEVLKKIKHHPILQYCPVIFQTSRANDNDIAEGMNAGAYYYLIKPFSEKVLLSIVKTAINDHSRFKEIQRSLEQTKQTMGRLKSAVFEFKTLEDVHSIASLVSNACPNPSEVVIGLTELMINAVEHGNLGITYYEKSVLNDKGLWINEVNDRLQLFKNKNKIASISFQRQLDCIEIIIIDQGNGFNWQDYLNFSPSRGMDNHGRGIAIANKLSFSSIEYKGLGNEVYALISFKIE